MLFGEQAAVLMAQQEQRQEAAEHRHGGRERTGPADSPAPFACAATGRRGDWKGSSVKRAMPCSSSPSIGGEPPSKRRPHEYPAPGTLHASPDSSQAPDRDAGVQPRPVGAAPPSGQYGQGAIAAVMRATWQSPRISGPSSFPGGREPAAETSVMES